MGFFQDLKEDLSLAVGELLPEEETIEKELPDLEEDTAVDEAIKEVEKALAEEFGKEEMVQEDSPEEDEIQPQEEEAEEEIEGEEVAEESDSEESDSEEEDTAEEEEVEEIQTEDATAEEVEEPKNIEETVEAQSAAQPVIDAAAAQIASIANIVAKEEMGDGEDFEEREIQTPEELLRMEQETATVETELEKEVEKAMAEQMMNLAQEEVVDETAVITAGMIVTGDMISKGSIEILGKIKGNVEILGKLNVSGTIEGDSKAAEIFADSAHVTGKVVADGTVKIGQNSVIIGDIVASSAVIAGAVKGDIDVQGPVILDASAIVMGNIKSKSVQINNGAVIEGMCSQCYAEVNPTSFFDDLIQK